MTGDQQRHRTHFPTSRPGARRAIPRNTLKENDP